MVFWLWVGFAILAAPPVAYGVVMAALYLYIRWKYAVDPVSAVRELFHRKD